MFLMELSMGKLKQWIAVGEQSLYVCDLRALPTFDKGSLVKFFGSHFITARYKILVALL